MKRASEFRPASSNGCEPTNFDSQEMSFSNRLDILSAFQQRSWLKTVDHRAARSAGEMEVNEGSIERSREYLHAQRGL